MSPFPIHAIPVVELFAPEIRELVPRLPSQMWVQGSDRALGLLNVLPERGLGVVGTRHPSPKSHADLMGWMQALATRELVVVSGFATGIDAIAHAGALRAGLPTVAICGAGLDIEYPYQNQALKREILRHDGLFISEYPPGQAAVDYQFIQRNRWIAALSRAVWIVEAGMPSGRSTPQTGRELFIAIVLPLLVTPAIRVWRVIKTSSTTITRGRFGAYIA